ncbi:undecaprenyl/decaprenyl-phosphate alpha-N-acetylglucosaminyl 1-phosphate transferase [bacterium]|nr:MAG: undecaprenyl/decaprenyl-phosphate alpha-N-acetylglucosaminyl 1-phosphate transferase [bacterium]
MIGGISIGIVFIILSLLALYFYGFSSVAVIGALVSSGIMLIFGMLDDLREMSIMSKFLVQIAATALLVSFGVRTHIVSIGNLANILITFVWILAITNAFNHLDIMDGLAAGVAIISSLGFFIISVINQDARSAALSLVLAGALFSFLIYNLPPARIYMGNAGSHFLGFALAAIALIISYAPMGREVALFSPILILGFPVFDTAFVILMRLNKNKIPFKKSDDHLALRILRNGHSKNKTLFLMLSLCVLFVLSGIALSKAPNLFGLALLILVILVCTIITIKFGKPR